MDFLVSGAGLLGERSQQRIDRRKAGQRPGPRRRFKDQPAGEHLIGDDIASMVQGFAYPSTFYAKIFFVDFLALSLAMLGIVLLAALYPALYAARLEPAAALRQE